MRPHPRPGENRLLAALPAQEFRRLRKRMQRVHLPPRAILYQQSEPIPQVYFPRDAVASLRIFTEEGAVAEAASVGREGLVGLPVFLGSGIGPAEAITQIEGEALTMAAEPFKAEVQRSPALRALLLRYTEAFIKQVAQTSACNQVHPVEARTARWLLTARDRAERDELPLTHQFLAELIGIRRVTVTQTIGALARAGYIDSPRGAIAVLDRPGLEATACECYEVIRATERALWEAFSRQAAP
jgi:CRP-like cAMP-binding protein